MGLRSGKTGAAEGREAAGRALRLAAIRVQCPGGQSVKMFAQPACVAHMFARQESQESYDELGQLLGLSRSPTLYINAHVPTPSWQLTMKMNKQPHQQAHTG